jgi:5'-3' exonuclease
MPSERKKLFLVDAMAHIFRAFYAPMNRMSAPSGIPTKVPFLFANILHEGAHVSRQAI